MATLRRTQTTTSRNSSELIPVRALIQESWQTFREEWKKTFSISILLLVPALAVLLIGLLDRILPADSDSFLSTFILIACACFEIWVNLRLMQYVLKQEGEMQTIKELPWAASIGGYLWLEVLQRIAIIGAALPVALGIVGLPVFIILSHLPEGAVIPVVALSVLVLAIPALWLGIQLAFWPFVFLTHPEGADAPFTHLGSSGMRVPSFKKSIVIFTESYQLVRGRFWAVLGRLFFPGLLFLGLFLITTGGIDTLFTVLVGEAKMNKIFEAIPQGYAYFLITLGQALFLPLFITWQVKLFRSLKQTTRS